MFCTNKSYDVVKLSFFSQDTPALKKFKVKIYEIYSRKTKIGCGKKIFGGGVEAFSRKNQQLVSRMLDLQFIFY